MLPDVISEKDAMAIYSLSMQTQIDEITQDRHIRMQLNEVSILSIEVLGVLVQVGRKDQSLPDGSTIRQVGHGEQTVAAPECQVGDAHHLHLLEAAQCRIRSICRSIFARGPHAIHAASGQQGQTRQDSVGCAGGGVVAHPGLSAAHERPPQQANLECCGCAGIHGYVIVVV